MACAACWGLRPKRGRSAGQWRGQRKPALGTDGRLTKSGDLWGLLDAPRHERGPGVRFCRLEGGTGDSQYGPHPLQGEAGRSLTVCFLKTLFISLKPQTKAARKHSCENPVPRKTRVQQAGPHPGRDRAGALCVHSSPRLPCCRGEQRRGPPGLRLPGEGHTALCSGTLFSH